MKNLLIALLAISPIAHADGIYFGGWSNHIKGNTDSTGYKYNDKHDLLAIKYKNAFVGTMINSYHARSYVAGYSFDLYDNSYIDIDLLAGGVHGYTQVQNDILRLGSINGFLAPLVTINAPYIKPTFMLFGSAAVLTFKYEF